MSSFVKEAMQSIEDYQVIDGHAHLGRWNNFFIPEGGDASSLVQVMDRVGVKAAIVSHLLGVGPDAPAGNKLLQSALRKYPGRFYGYLVVNPHFPHLEVVKESLKGSQIVGLKIHPDTHEYPVDGPLYRPLWELANENRALVLSHTFHGSAYSDPKSFSRILQKYPNVTLLMGHMGALTAGFRSSVQVAERFPNAYLELCGSYITAKWIEWTVDKIGDDRVIFGTDFPFIDFRYGLGRVLFSELSADQKKNILSGNISRLLQARGVTL